VWGIALLALYFFSAGQVIKIHRWAMHILYQGGKLGNLVYIAGNWYTANAQFRVIPVKLEA
jgi:hypothetical protein